MSDLLMTNPILVWSAALAVLGAVMLFGWLAYVLTRMRHSGVIVVTLSERGEKAAA